MIKVTAHELEPGDVLPNWDHTARNSRKPIAFRVLWAIHHPHGDTTVKVEPISRQWPKPSPKTVQTMPSTTPLYVSSRTMTRRGST